MRNAQIDAWVRGWVEKPRQYWEMVKPLRDAEQAAATLVQTDKQVIADHEARIRAGETLTRQQTAAYLAACSRELEGVEATDGKSAGERYVLALGQLPGLVTELKALEAEAGDADFEKKRARMVAGMRARQKEGHKTQL